MSDDFMRRFQICDRHLSQGGGHYVEVDESGPWVCFQDAESLLKAAIARAEAAEAKLALLSNVRNWLYYPIEMPVTSEGYGPASYNEADRMTYEVWDRLLSSHASFDNLPDAINEAIRLNLAELKGETNV